MPSGFHAYWIYVTVKKMHFGPSKYDITTQPLPRKEMFLKKWNSERKDKDGILFQKFMERMPRLKEHYIRCFSRYYLDDFNFHISDVINNKMSLYKRNELELDGILNTVRSDLITVLNFCHNKGIKYGLMFEGDRENLPYLLRLYDRGKISPNSLIAFDHAFKIADRLDNKSVNIVDQEKIKNYKNIFVEYQKVVYNYFVNRNWLVFCKEIYHELQA